MARRRTLSDKHDVIRRLRKGQSIRSIRNETGIHRSVIRSIKQVSEEYNWLDLETQLPGEIELRKALKCPSQNRCKEHPMEAYREDIKRWLDEKNSYILIHEYLLQRGLNLSESTVRRRIQSMFPERFHKPTMLRDTTPGEILEVDFGSLGMVYDSKERRNRKAYVFSARFRHSREAYREICLDQKQETFFMALIHAFEHFGGVPQKVVPDNLKAAVIQASFSEPILNKIFQKMAIHYDFLISPTLPARPEHKGGVESDIKYIKGNFLPRFKENQRQQGHDVPHLEGMQKALEDWSENVAEKREIKGVGRTPVDMFNQDESEALRPLPKGRWNIVSWATAKVQESWRIQYRKSFYSVPYQYIGKKVTVYADLLNVVIYYDDKEIARHQRAERLWSIKREDHHAPKNVQMFLQDTKGSLLDRAERFGDSVLVVCQRLFDSRGADGLRPVRSLLALVKNYGPHRLDAACRRALLFDDSPRYSSIKTILKKGLESQELPQVPKVNKQREFTFQREPEYFEGSKILMEVSNG